MNYRGEIEDIIIEIMKIQNKLMAVSDQLAQGNSCGEEEIRKCIQKLCDKYLHEAIYNLKRI